MFYLILQVICLPLLSFPINVPFNSSLWDPLTLNLFTLNLKSITPISLITAYFAVLNKLNRVFRFENQSIFVHSFLLDTNSIYKHPFVVNSMKRKVCLSEHLQVSELIYDCHRRKINEYAYAPFHSDMVE